MPTDIRKNKDDEFLNPGKVMLILWSRWYWIAASLLLWFLAAQIYILYTPPLYSSSASIRIEDNQNQLSSLSGIPLQRSTSARIQTELVLLKSRTILENALNQIDWQLSFFANLSGKRIELYPEKPFKLNILSKEINYFTGEIQFRYVNKRYYELGFVQNGRFHKKKCRWNTIQIIPGLQFIITDYAGNLPGNTCSFVFNTKTSSYRRILHGLSITESGKFSSILLLQKRDTNPVFAADILNAIITQYLQNDLRQKTESALKVSEFIDQQYHYLSAGLAISGKVLESFKNDTEIINAEHYEEETLQKLNEVKNQNDGLTIQMATIGAAEKILDQDSVPGTELAQSLNDPLLTGVLARIENLKLQKLQSLSTYRSGSSIIKIIQSQLEALTEQSRKLLKAQKQQVEYLLKINKAEAKHLTRKIQNFPTKRRRFEQALSSYLTNQKVLNFLSEKKLETRIGTASLLPGASLVDKAVPEYTPVFPSKRSVWRAAFIFGLLSGITFIFLKRAARRMFVQNDANDDRLYSSMYGPI